MRLPLKWELKTCRILVLKTSSLPCRPAVCRSLLKMAADVELPLPGRQISKAELGDRIFVVGGKLLLLLLLIVAVLMPLLAIFWRGFSAEEGQGGGWIAARELVTSDNFHWLVGNSLKVSLSVAAIVVPLAYVFAYALQRTLIPGKRICRDFHRWMVAKGREQRVASQRLLENT